MTALLKEKFRNLWIFYAIELVAVVLLVTGVLPRFAVPWFAGFLALYSFLAPLQIATLFFIASIPFFIAIPITATFDNFNTWRILSLIIFCRWAVDGFQTSKFKLQTLREHPVVIASLALLVLAGLSLINAVDIIAGARRIIYFVNLALIGIVVYDMVKNHALKITQLVQAIAVPTILVAVIGFLQLASTYMMDIFQFVDVWDRQIQRVTYGAGWADIALKANTWFAYYGDQLSLRMFSTFPDSHSFPIFLLLGLPAVFALSLAFVIGNRNGLLSYARTRGTWVTIMIPAIFLAMLLSGTRGIWAASIPVVLFAGSLIWFMDLRGTDKSRVEALKYISFFLSLFFLLLPVAYSVFISDQFHMRKEDAGLFKRRVRSIIDIAETSNRERLRIWKLSALSIAHHPLLGVGIGNFPVVLNQDTSLARAGSSAHNLYLHIAAEAGILAMLFFLYLLWTVFRANYEAFLESENQAEIVYLGSMLLFFPWVLIYSLTDVALFDERAFSLFVVSCAIVLALSRSHHE